VAYSLSTHGRQPLPAISNYTPRKRLNRLTSQLIANGSHEIGRLTESKIQGPGAGAPAPGPWIFV